MDVKDYNQKDFFNSLRNKRSEKADYLHQLLKRHGINFATGTPCGVLRNIIDNLLNDPDIFHVSVNRESEAVGIAAGAYFSGKIPVVYMQNSGLFASSNDIASLLIPYKIPIFFVVTYRGCEGEDAIQHLTTGKATEKLLDSFSLSYKIYNGQNLEILIDQMFIDMEKTSLPTMLLLKRGWNL
ncbi:MAG: sulfopyruvate decarboxylase subunit alpha [Flavobacterium sp.]|nr:sulfopyruvate decarboxylase subunit alpha [Flavobacterium sp.]